jgi:hypothetical protein
MKQKLCPICKSPIVCTYQREDLFFYIEKRQVKRDENPDLWADHPFVFHCSNDKEHPVILDTDWCNEFENEIAKVVTEVKLNV